MTKNLSLSAVFVAVTLWSPLTHASGKVPHDAEQKKAILECDNLARSESESWREWANSRGIPFDKLHSYTLNMCLNGVVAARDASSIKDIDNWQVDAFNRNAYLGFDAINIKAVPRSAQIAKTYFNAIHGIKGSNNSQSLTYPQLSSNASGEEKLAAMDSYSSLKKINGVSIKSHCEYAVAHNDFTYGIRDEHKESISSLASQAITICKGIMVNVVTKGSHGLSVDKLQSMTTFKKDSPEFIYLDRVAEWAWKEAK